jgi:hypothetical protein
MTWLVEDPTPTLVAAALIVALLILALVKTGRGVLLWAVAGVALLAVALLALERVIVTDTERVEETLSGAAQALEANDPQAVLSYIDPASPIRGEVTHAMSHVTIHKASFNRLSVTFNRHTSPPTAEADFMGYINIKDRRGEIPYENVTSSRFKVQLRISGDRWLVTGYEMPGRDGSRF